MVKLKEGEKNGKGYCVQLCFSLGGFLWFPFPICEDLTVAVSHRGQADRII